MSLLERVRRPRHADTADAAATAPGEGPGSRWPRWPRWRGRGGAEASDAASVREARQDFSRRRRRDLRRRLRPLAVLLAVLALAAGATWVLLGSSLVAVDRVQVTGATTVSGDRVRAAADVTTGTPVARVDLAAAARRVEGIPEVAAAVVTRSWPHAVRVEVTERTALAAVEAGGSLRALDREGVLFRDLPTKPARIPLVRALPRGTSPDPEALVEVGRVVDALPPALARRVGFLEVASVDRIRLRLRNGLVVRWGSADSSAAKARVVGVLLHTKPAEIDVSVPSRPTTRQ